MISQTITTAGTQEAFYHTGGAANFSLSGTFGGTSVALEFNLADSTEALPAGTWVPLQDSNGDLAITAEYGNTTLPLASCWVRAITTGGTGINLVLNWKPVKFL